MFDNEQPRQRRNDEIRMSKETRRPKLECFPLRFSRRSGGNMRAGWADGLLSTINQPTVAYQAQSSPVKASQG